MEVRRRRINWFIILGVFVAVLAFVFLVQRFNHRDEADAASLANFDPGYIISDYQMSNYNSMSESQIQSFLNSKVSCNKDRSYYDYLKRNYPGFDWHFKDGHIVCLPEERFGNGETIGSGDTAARIIWQAAQDYRINPKVLIVLLQKEQGLITDAYPNTRQYRSATGYGCPDTAACSSKYYGFKNQVRNAAAMFRTVLDGGWTNYPLGNNYIQYNPNAACGGSVVNIRSLATSALYRYTPYQPNAGALAAGYGTASCGAYGNRNFYLYFQDWFGGITTTQKSVKITEGKYYILSSSARSMSLDVDSGLVNNGTNIQLYKRNNTKAQQWTISYNPTTDDYSIINVLSGKALDVDGASTKNGANIQIWEHNDTCAQRWKIIETSGEVIKIISSCSDKALDISSGKMENGGNIQLWSDNGTSAQRWVLVPVEVVENGLYHIISTVNNKSVVDISGGAYNAINGTNVQIWSNNYTTAQRWYIEKDNNDYYTIKNKQSGKVLDVSGASTKDGANIHVYASNGTCAQKWRILKNDNGYTFISACSHKVLDLAKAETKSGTNVRIYSPNGTKAQIWRLSPISIVKPGVYQIASRLDEEKVVDIANGSKYNGANVQMYKENGTGAQDWEISYDEKTDSYRIFNKMANKSVDVDSGSREIGANVQMYASNNTCAQKWAIVETNDGYAFYSSCSGLALDVKGASTKNGTNVWLYKSNDTTAQRWILK